MKPAPGFETSIIHLEMVHIVVALRVWGYFWQHSHIMVYCDNLAVVNLSRLAKRRTLTWHCASEISAC